MKYDFVAIERRWQEKWAKDGTFRVRNPGEPGFDPAKPKYYVLDMFPYPSGAGLHVGHPLGYIATDIIARYKRMCGYNVLHPMGFDAFGLPAEQYAVEHGVHPRVTTEQNIANITRQLRRLGLSYDWDRALATTDPEYYRWTQWIFLQLFDSWHDPWQDRARPVSELRRGLESGELLLTHTGGLRKADAMPADTDTRPWTSLSEPQQRQAIDDRRLAYMGDVTVNWCPALGTVLANEEVTNEGRSDRGNHPVYKRPLRQWMLRITAYAERLASDLDRVDWPESVAKMQREWIGRSEGAFIEFALADGDDRVRVFTTRPDTLFGATYLVLAPEHPLVETVTSSEQRPAMQAYRAQAEAKSDVTRQAEAASGSKSGVFTGGYAVNPATQERIPVWVADYVLMGYGTGAIMAVPASDERDFEFARAFDLDIRPVVLDRRWLEREAEGAGWTERDDALVARYQRDAALLSSACTGAGVAIGSQHGELSLDGMTTDEAKCQLTGWLEATGHGKGAVQYKLRDWLFSRQRYWGEPFPILHGPDGQMVAVDPSELPVELPPMDDFRPEASEDPDAPPRPPLARAPESWRVVERDGKVYRRELNTMPQWAGSCWYYLRFLDPTNRDRFVDPAVEAYWMAGAQAGASDTPGPTSEGIDLYMGGVEHAVLHLLYARFWHKVLFDLGHVSTPEPFARLYNQGYILAPSYKNARGTYVPADEIEERDGGWFYDGEPVTREVGKMGKSLKNALTPDDICEQYGADTLRLYEMYLGPIQKSKLWSTHDILGVHRFLQRLWRNVIDDRTGASKVTDEPASEALRKRLHRTVHRVTEDMNGFEFNTAIARLIELNNELVALETLPREVAIPVLLMLAPMAPHMAEELWARLELPGPLAYAAWPTFDPQYLIEDEVEIPVQVNGKTRSKVRVAADADAAVIEQAARSDERIARMLVGKTVRRVILVPGRLVNLVIG